DQTRAGEPVAQVRRSERGAVVSLRAGAGSDLVGFRVWREVAGRRELLTPGLVAGPALVTRATLLAGSDTAWADADPIPGSDYLVESLHRDGRVQWSRASAASGPPPAATAAPLGRPAPGVVERPVQQLPAADAPTPL